MRWSSLSYYAFPISRCFSRGIAKQESCNGIDMHRRDIGFCRITYCLDIDEEQASKPYLKGKSLKITVHFLCKLCIICSIYVNPFLQTMIKVFKPICGKLWILRFQLWKIFFFLRYIINWWKMSAKQLGKWLTSWRVVTRI